MASEKEKDVLDEPQNAHLKTMIDMEEIYDREKTEIEKEEKILTAKRKHLEELAIKLKIEKSKYGLGDQTERKQDRLQHSLKNIGDKQSGIKCETQDTPTQKTNEFEKTPEADNSQLQDLKQENKILKEQLGRFERVTEDIKFKDVSKEGTECETEHYKDNNMISLKDPNITTLETKNKTDAQPESLRNLFEKLVIDKRELLEQMNVLEGQFRKLETDNIQLVSDKDDLLLQFQAQNDQMEASVNQLKSERDELLLRLSKFAGEKLALNNPAITDLSDQNRPTKLGEFYSELYDNEWTNAFDGLEKGGYDETTAVETLRLTLESVMQFCESKADLLLQRASDAVNLIFEENKEFDMSLDMKVQSETMPIQQGQDLQRYKESIDRVMLQHRWKPKQNDKPVRHRPASESEQEQTRIDADNKLKQLRKDMATSMIPVVQKAYIAAFWTNELIEELKPYIRKCLYLCWMTVVQSPPMVLHSFSGEREIEKEITFDKNMYRAYRKSGPFVSYVVWPALLLNKDGPLVCKGVAEGKTV